MKLKICEMLNNERYSLEGDEMDKKFNDFLFKILSDWKVCYDWRLLNVAVEKIFDGVFRLTFTVAGEYYGNPNESIETVYYPYACSFDELCESVSEIVNKLEI